MGGPDPVGQDNGALTGGDQALALVEEGSGQDRGHGAAVPDFLAHLPNHAAHEHGADIGVRGAHFNNATDGRRGIVQQLRLLSDVGLVGHNAANRSQGGGQQVGYRMDAVSQMPTSLGSNRDSWYRHGRTPKG